MSVHAGVAALGAEAATALLFGSIGAVVKAGHNGTAAQVPQRPHAAQVIPFLVEPPAGPPLALRIGISRIAPAAAKLADFLAAPSEAAETVIAALAHASAEAVIAEAVFKLAGDVLWLDGHQAVLGIVAIAPAPIGNQVAIGIVVEGLALPVLTQRFLRRSIQVTPMAR